MWCEEGASCWLKEEVGWGQAPYGSPSRGLWRGVPYSGLSHGTHRSLLVGRLLPLGWRLWWVLPWAFGHQWPGLSLRLHSILVHLWWRDLGMSPCTGRRWPRIAVPSR